MGRFPDESTAREFIAEVYANWATGKGHIPATIAKRFATLTGSKNAILQLKAQEAAFTSPVKLVVDPHQQEHFNWFIAGLVASVVVVVLLNQ